VAGDIKKRPETKVPGRFKMQIQIDVVYKTATKGCGLTPATHGPRHSRLRETARVNTLPQFCPPCIHGGLNGELGTTVIAIPGR
jgi:hypothetical protein